MEMEMPRRLRLHLFHRLLRFRQVIASGSTGGSLLERELRGEEQLPPGIPGICAGSFRQTQRAGRDGAKVRGRGEVSGAGGGAGAGVLSINSLAIVSWLLAHLHGRLRQLVKASRRR